MQAFATIRERSEKAEALFSILAHFEPTAIPFQLIRDGSSQYQSFLTKPYTYDHDARYLIDGYLKYQSTTNISMRRNRHPARRLTHSQGVGRSRQSFGEKNRIMRRSISQSTMQMQEKPWPKPVDRVHRLAVFPRTKTILTMPFSHYIMQPSLGIQAPIYCGCTILCRK